MIFQDNNKLGFEVHVSNTDHTCGQIENSQHAKSVSDQMKKVIISCAEKKMFTKCIVKHINEMRETLEVFLNEQTPSESQIIYIIRNHKKNKTPKILHLGELIEWCEKKHRTSRR